MGSRDLLRRETIDLVHDYQLQLRFLQSTAGQVAIKARLYKKRDGWLRGDKLVDAWERRVQSHETVDEQTAYVLLQAQRTIEARREGREQTENLRIRTAEQDDGVDVVVFSE